MKLYIFIIITVLYSCSNKHAAKNDTSSTATIITPTQKIELPQPHSTKSAIRFCEVLGWHNGQKPVAPQGFVVTEYARDLKSARWIYQLPNGDVLVSQANTELKGVKKIGADIIGADQAMNISGSPDRITLLRDENNDGTAEIQYTFFEGLDKPFGMLLIGNTFYIAATDGIWTYMYNEGDISLNGEGKKILDLPAGGYNNHWTRNIIANKDQSKIYVSVGSASNVGDHGMENEVRRACILEINPDGSGERIFADGLRNPVGMGWATGTNTLWTSVNERDNLGDDLVPDYMTSVQEGGFYGWPYSYFGKNMDPRIKEKDQRPELVDRAIVPDVALGSHTASLGLAFYSEKQFPSKYHEGAFIGQHGSWNRSELAGYKVAFVPFRNGIPSGPPEDFLTGFIANPDKGEVYGRPVGVTVLNDGSMLVADDAGNVVWRITVR